MAGIGKATPAGEVFGAEFVADHALECLAAQDLFVMKGHGVGASMRGNEEMVPPFRWPRAVDGGQSVQRAGNGLQVKAALSAELDALSNHGYM